MAYGIFFFVEEEGNEHAVVEGIIFISGVVLQSEE